MLYSYYFILKSVSWFHCCFWWLITKVSLCPQGKQWNRCWTKPEHYGDIVMKRQRIRSSFRTAFCFLRGTADKNELFRSISGVFLHVRAQLPPPTFQQEAERNPRSKSSGGSLPEKVMIVTNVPVLQCGQRRRSVLFSGLGDWSFTPNCRCKRGNRSRFHVPLNRP